MFMTNFQQSISIFDHNKLSDDTKKNKSYVDNISVNSMLLLATQYEINKHEKYLKYMKKKKQVNVFG